MDSDNNPLYFCLQEYFKDKNGKLKEKYNIDNSNILYANKILSPQDLEKLLCLMADVYMINYKNFQSEFENEFKNNVDSKVKLRFNIERNISPILFYH